MIKLNNFYILLIASIIIGSPIIFLKNDLLKSLTITEEIIIVSLGILAIVSFIYFGYENKSFKNLISVGEKNKYKLCLYIALITITLLIGNYIVKSEGKVIRYKSFQRALSLILMLIIGHYIFGEKITMNTCWGIGIIIFGLYVLDR
jgi:drug/metabolite transporter (DMT)-like permease